MSLFQKKDKITYTGGTEPAGRRLLRSVAELIQVALVVAAVVLPVRYFLIQPFYVKGASMEPTFEDKEYLIIDEISYRLRAPERGEVVVFRYPNNPSEFFIKRIVGLPGDKVRIANGKVYVTPTSGTERLLDESYLPAGTETAVQSGERSWSVGQDEYFVMGDNRGNSLDSRIFGPLPKNDLIGRVMLRGWPINRVTWFEAPTYGK